MNTEERVLTALRRERPDRVPVFLYLDPEAPADTWYIRDPSYAEVLSACRQLVDVVYDWYIPAGWFLSAGEQPIEQRLRPDGLTEQVMHTPRGPLTRLLAPDWRGSGEVKRWIATVEDARRALSIPYTPLRPDLTGFLQTRAARAGSAVAQVTFPDPICQVGYTVEEEVLAVWTVEQRPLLREMLEVFSRRICELLRHALEGGIGPVFYFNGPELALPPLMSPRDFEEFVVEYDRPLVELVHSYPGRYVIFHSHGRVNRFLERFAAIGIDGLNVLEPPPMGDTDLADAKRRIRDRVCLIGNVQYDDLARGSREDVERLVRRAIEQGAPGGGFILSPCASPYETPLPPKAAENLIAYLEAGRKWGGYENRQ